MVTMGSAAATAIVAIGNTPDEDPLLGYQDVAAVLTELGRPTKASTIRAYRRAGIMPVPDEQIGGHEPVAGEAIKCWPGTRDPQPGERIGATQVYWRRSTILDWNEQRPGPGGWRGRRAARAGDRDARYGRTPGGAAVAG